MVTDEPPLHDFLIVGPSFILSGSTRAVAPDLTLTVRRRDGAVVGLARSVPGPDGTVWLTVEMAAPTLAADHVVEIYRLFSRVVTGLTGYRVPVHMNVDLRREGRAGATLRTDGFTSGDKIEWRRPPVPFLRPGSKALTMEQVYDDLYSVPWNFVGREWDVLKRLIGNATDAARDVIDLGCGVGKNASALEERGFNVFGIDSSCQAISGCRCVVGHPERFVAGSVAALPWSTESFDHALDVGCFHCMPPEEVDAGVREAARVLKPGGLLHSRVFKPRSASWARSQPMAVASFGMEASRLAVLLDAYFDCESIDEHPHVTYVRARKR